jgi:pimeloyl-ACP methyl ester carboxylesterase
MPASILPVSYLENKISGLYAEGSDGRLPLLVMFPGGGSNAEAFNLPHASFMHTASDNGYSAIALNRPGQADSASLPLDPIADVGAFDANAARLCEAIDEIWSRKNAPHSGVVIYGSSIGGAIALHAAAKWSREKRAWPLLGVAVADIGQSPPRAVVDTWTTLPVQETINLAQYMGLFFSAVPPWAAPVLPPRTRSEVPVLKIPRAELQEVVGGWPRDWRAICSRITVPVSYSMAKYDTVWTINRTLLNEFAEMLAVNSPYVESAIIPGASHGIGLGPLATSHILQVLSFVSRCHVAARVPQVLVR